MKILHILDHSIPLHSGYTFRSRAIIDQQRKFGWETFHVTSAKQKQVNQEVEDVDGLKFFRTQIKNNFIWRLPIVNQWVIIKTLFDRLDQIIPLIKPDILHAHSPSLNGLAAISAGNKHNIPVVYECRAFWEDAAVDHGTTTEGSIRYRVTKALENLVFKRANAITTICQGLRNDIIERGIIDSKITVIPNAVNIDKFNLSYKAESDLRMKLGLQDHTVLGFIGSFYAYEGLLLLVEAMPEILKKWPNTKLLLVGGGPQEPILKVKIQEYGLNEHVILTGRIPHDEVTEYYNLVDLFIYPRLSMRLTEIVTPLKPLEAMAQGKMVLCSDVGGHEELVKAGETGEFFNANDAKSLSKAAIDLLNRKESWHSYQTAARAFVECERNWEKSVSNYIAVYNGL